MIDLMIRLECESEHAPIGDCDTLIGKSLVPSRNLLQFAIENGPSRNS